MERTKNSASLRRALVISLRPGRDLADLVQIAKSEGKKLFRGLPVRVEEVFQSSRAGDWVVVVQASEGVSESKLNRQ